MPVNFSGVVVLAVRASHGERGAGGRGDNFKLNLTTIQAEGRAVLELMSPLAFGKVAGPTPAS